MSDLVNKPQIQEAKKQKAKKVTILRSTKEVEKVLETVLERHKEMDKEEKKNQTIPIPIPTSQSKDNVKQSIYSDVTWTHVALWNSKMNSPQPVRFGDVVIYPFFTSACALVRFTQFMIIYLEKNEKDKKQQVEQVDQVDQVDQITESTESTKSIESIEQEQQEDITESQSQPKLTSTQDAIQATSHPKLVDLRDSRFISKMSKLIQNTTDNVVVQYLSQHAPLGTSSLKKLRFYVVIDPSLESNKGLNIMRLPVYMLDVPDAGEEIEKEKKQEKQIDETTEKKNLCSTMPEELFFEPSFEPNKSLEPIKNSNPNPNSHSNVEVEVTSGQQLKRLQQLTRSAFRQSNFSKHLPIHVNKVCRVLQQLERVNNHSKVETRVACAYCNKYFEKYHPLQAFGVMSAYKVNAFNVIMCRSDPCRSSVLKICAEFACSEFKISKEIATLRTSIMSQCMQLTLIQDVLDTQKSALIEFAAAKYGQKWTNRHFLPKFDSKKFYLSAADSADPTLIDPKATRTRATATTATSTTPTTPTTPICLLIKIEDITPRREDITLTKQQTCLLEAIVKRMHEKKHKIELELQLLQELEKDQKLPNIKRCMTEALHAKQSEFEQVQQLHANMPLLQQSKTWDQSSHASSPSSRGFSQSSSQTSQSSSSLSSWSAASNSCPPAPGSISSPTPKTKDEKREQERDKKNKNKSKSESENETENKNKNTNKPENKNKNKQDAVNAEDMDANTNNSPMLNSVTFVHLAKTLDPSIPKNQNILMDKFVKVYLFNHLRVGPLDSNPNLVCRDQSNLSRGKYLIFEVSYDQRQSKQYSLTLLHYKSHDFHVQITKKSARLWTILSYIVQMCHQESVAAAAAASAKKMNSLTVTCECINWLKRTVSKFGFEELHDTSLIMSFLEYLPILKKYILAHAKNMSKRNT